MIEQFPLFIGQRCILVQANQIRHRHRPERRSDQPRLLDAETAQSLLVVGDTGLRQNAACHAGEFLERQFLSLSPSPKAQTDLVEGIDAPERGQPFGKRATERMSDLVAGQDVTVNWQKADRWGRLIGTVWVVSPDCRAEPCPKTLNAGLAPITSGLAWHFKRHAREQSEEDRERCAFAEEEARAIQAGLWSDPNPVPP